MTLEELKHVGMVKYIALILNVIFIATIIIMAVIWSKHECQKQELPTITEKHLQQIKRIGNAETKNDIDSLLMEFYGFKSE